MICIVFTLFHRLQNEKYSAKLKKDVLDFLVTFLNSEDYNRGRQYDILHFTHAVILSLAAKNVSPPWPGLGGAYCHVQMLKETLPHGSCPGSSGRKAVTETAEESIAMFQCGIGISSVKKGLEHVLRDTTEEGQLFECSVCWRKKAAFARFTKMLNVRDSLLVGVHRYDQQSGADKVKLHDKIAFDVELDVAPFMMDSSQKTKIMKDNVGRVPMELKAISCHEGKDLDRGHYFAYAKQISGQWLRISDTDVEEVAVSKVMSEVATVVLLRYDMV